MTGWKPFAVILMAVVLLCLLAQGALAAASVLFGPGTSATLIELSSDYRDEALPTVAQQLYHRLTAQPFNLVATVIFALAILHTLLANSIHRFAMAMRKRLGVPADSVHAEAYGIREPDKWFVVQLLAFLGEVEIVFALWVVPLMLLMSFQYSWDVAVHHLNSLDFIEPLFVVVMMTLASSYPVIRFAENALASLARWGNNGPVAWWIILLTVGPLLGAFITEPAAMTVTALLLARQFYAYKPSPKLAYATLGLLFTNISVGGVLTNFAAPPVLMVAKKWVWTTPYMMGTFGWKAIAGIIVTNVAYYLAMRREFAKLKITPVEGVVRHADKRLDSITIPSWIIIVQLLFLIWAVLNLSLIHI